MLKASSQEIVDKILSERIAQLKGLILTGNEVSVSLGGLSLALIGTKEAVETIMDMIRTSEDPELIEILIPLVMLSTFRAEYRAELEILEHKELVAEIYADMADLDPRALGEQPLCQVIAEALEKQFIREQV